MAGAVPGRSALVGALVAALVTAACAGGAAETPQPRGGEAAAGAAPLGTPQSGYTLTVARGGRALARLTLADLQRLPQVSLVIEGREQAGPTLLSVLAAAGAGEFTRVTVVGKSKGRLTSRELRLDRARVTDRVLLDFNKRGQTKLASPDIPSERWVIDVEELMVE